MIEESDRPISPEPPPPRSPAAERFDPPLLRRRAVLPGGGTLDEALARLCDAVVDRDRIEVALRTGGVHLNGHPLDPTALPGRVPPESWLVAWCFVRPPEPVPFDAARILVDADGVVAVDKPPWLTMQRTRATDHGHLEGLLRTALDAPALRAVHRLDRQTSGVALFARDRDGARALQQALEARRIEKHYVACVSPPPSDAPPRATGAIARIDGAGRFRFGVCAASEPGARSAETRLLWGARSADGRRQRVSAQPVTGRTHQIRVHLAALGAPIVGDDLYGPVYRAGAAHSAERVLLHAARVRVPWPDGSLREIEAALPGDLDEAAL